MTKNKQKSQILVKNNAPARNAHPEPRTWGPQVAPSGPMGPMGPMGAHGGPMGAPRGSPYIPALFPFVGPYCCGVARRAYYAG